MSDQKPLLVFVCGLSFRVRIASFQAMIGGPAIYSALGVLNTGISPQLITAFGNNLTTDDRRVIDAIDPQAYSRYPVKPMPMIEWRSSAILGETGKGQLSADPEQWTKVPEIGEVADTTILVLANGDPVVYSKLLAVVKPTLIFMDVYSEWLKYRSKEVGECLRKADVVTMTEREYSLLPKLALSGITFGQDNKILVLKRGAKGVSIVVSGEVHDLPPASPSFVYSDVGCGDFLLGLIAGEFVKNRHTEPPMPLSKLVIDAYIHALQPLAHFMESSDHRNFSLNQIQQR